MKHILLFLGIIFTIRYCPVQTNEETAVAIDRFVSYITDSTCPSQKLFFCISYLPSDLQHNLPTTVSGYRCIYFSTRNREKTFKKMLKKNSTGRFYTIEVQTKCRDTIDFLFTQVDVKCDHGSYEVFAECLGMLPIPPDIRVINMPDGKMIIQSRIIKISDEGIERKNELS